MSRRCSRRAASAFPVIGEIELTARFLQGNVVAITGSNGKTTTTTLTGEIIASGGRKTLVGGNIGTPAITFVEQSSPDTWVVLEISSFQLESIETFHPHIAAILNVTPDHLDRHGSMESYIAAKARIFENQTAEDYAVLNADNEITRRLAQGLKPQLLVLQPPACGGARRLSCAARQSSIATAKKLKSCRSPRLR